MKILYSLLLLIVALLPALACEPPVASFEIEEIAGKTILLRNTSANVDSITWSELGKNDTSEIVSLANAPYGIYSCSKMPSVLCTADGPPASSCADIFQIKMVVTNECGIDSVTKEYSLATIQNRDSLVYPVRNFMLEKNKSWNEVYTFFDGERSSEQITEYTTGGFYSTVINGHSYTEIYQGLAETPHLLREYRGKVYQWNGTEDILLYDFDVQVGDQLEIGADKLSLTVDSTATTSAYGDVFRKVVYLSTPELHGTVTWIEGIGDMRGLLQSGRDPLLLCTCSYNLACCSVDGEQVYHNDAYPNCGYGYDLSLLQLYKTWNVVYSTFPDGMLTENLTILRTEGTYLATNSIKYREIYLGDAESPRYLRELDGNVFEWNGTQEYLIYDFHAQVGDQLEIGSDKLLLTVDSVDSFSDYSGNPRKVVYLSKPESQIPVTWIEGVGDTRGLLQSGLDPEIIGDFSYTLACSSVERNLIYQNDAFPSCGVKPNEDPGPHLLFHEQSLTINVKTPASLYVSDSCYVGLLSQGGAFEIMVNAEIGQDSLVYWQDSVFYLFDPYMYEVGFTRVIVSAVKDGILDSVVIEISLKDKDVMAWSQANGLTDVSITALLKYSTDTLFVGTETDGLYRSVDGGFNWSAYGLSNMKITALCRNQNRIFAGTYENGLFYQDAYSQTWYNEEFENLTVNDIKSVNDTIYLALDGGRSSMNYGAISYSIDNGRNWEVYFEQSIIQAVEKDEKNNLFFGSITSAYYLNGTELLGAVRGIFSAPRYIECLGQDTVVIYTNSYGYISFDNGRNASLFSYASNKHFCRVANVYYIDQGGYGLQFSWNIGEHAVWHNANLDVDVSHLVRNKNSLVAASEHGIYVSDLCPVSKMNIDAFVTKATGLDVLDGIIDIQVEGGRYPYSFEWSNGSVSEDLHAVIPGDYSVTVTDADGIQIHDSFTIAYISNQPLHISGNVFPANDGNPATVTYVQSIALHSMQAIANEDGAYQLEIPQGAWYLDLEFQKTGYRDSTISVQVTGDSITIPDMWLEKTNNPFAVTAKVKKATLFSAADGAIDITLSGGSAPYTFLWDNGWNSEDLLGVQNGTYSVTVTDSLGNTQQATFQVGVEHAGNFYITGTLKYADEVFTNASVMLYSNISGSFIPYLQTSVSKSGTYSFYQLPEAEYVLQAIPYGTDHVAPTYAYHSIRFAGAHQLHLAGNTSAYDIDLQSIVFRDAGQGRITGTVYSYNELVNANGMLVSITALKSTAVGVANIPVFVMQGNEVIAWSATDAMGQYEIEGLQDGTYDVLIEIPGFGSAQRTVTVINGEMSSAVNFSIAENQTITTDFTENDADQIVVYPNPVTENVYSSFINTSRLQLFSMDGVLLSEVEDANHLFMGHLPKGQYLLKVYSSQSSVSVLLFKD